MIFVLLQQIVVAFSSAVWHVCFSHSMCLLHRNTCQIPLLPCHMLYVWPFLMWMYENVGLWLERQKQFLVLFSSLGSLCHISQKSSCQDASRRNGWEHCCRVIWRPLKHNCFIVELFPTSWQCLGCSATRTSMRVMSRNRRIISILFTLKSAWNCELHCTEHSWSDTN